MIQIPDHMAPMLLQAVRDAVTYHEQLLTSETLRDRSDYEEYYVLLTQFFSEMKAEYKKHEAEIGIPLSQVIKGRE